MKYLSERLVNTCMEC